MLPTNYSQIIYIYIYIYPVVRTNFWTAQLGVAVEYTDHISTEG